MYVFKIYIFGFNLLNLTECSICYFELLECIEIFIVV